MYAGVIQLSLNPVLLHPDYAISELFTMRQTLFPLVDKPQAQRQYAWM